MTWVCQHPRCNRVTKGFRNGRTLCRYCQRSNDRQKRRLGRRCIEPGCAKPIASSASVEIVRCATCVRKLREYSLTNANL